MRTTLRIHRSAAAGLALLALAVAGCDVEIQRGPAAGGAPPSSSRNDVTARPRAEPAPAHAIELLFPYGSEKEKWVVAVTEEFNRAGHKTASGRPIFVRQQPIGSGELITEILEGRLQAHLASPASAAFVELGNADSIAQTGKPLLGETKNLVLSPVIIAMWRPMAEAIGWGKQPIGWEDIIRLAKDEQGWARYGFPQWGKFRFGHTHPEYSNSGLISVVAEVYAGAGKRRDLTLEDVAQPKVAEFLTNIERSVVHYGSSTGFFGRTMFERGPAYLSAAVLYENMVIESYDPAKKLDFPVVAIYPKEGTFWSDHPVGIVQREWVTAEHREAAKQYIDFLLAEPQQRRAMEFGFRPADVNVPLGAPIDTAHGVNPQEPQATLDVPPASVMKAVIELWKHCKKRANVVLAFDVSGSMQGEKIQSAREGAEQLVEMLGEDDLLSIVPFNDHVMWSARRLRLGDNRDRAKRIIGSLIADGGTALYDAIAASDLSFKQNPTPEMITAVVVLSDGADTASDMKIGALLNLLRGGSEAEGVRVFTIGYGSDARGDILKNISDSTNASYFKSDPRTIRGVFKDISTFF